MMRNVLVALIFAAVCSLACIGQVEPIDPANSKITIHAYKTGLFSFAGHDHIIEAPITSGRLDEKEKLVVVEIDTKNLRVLDPSETEKNRAEIQQTMLGSKLLDAEKYPEISFRSNSYRQHGSDSAEVQGKLSLHGDVRPITLTVNKQGNRWTGSARLKQTAFGMQPISLAGGTVKVKDEVKIEFEVAVKPK